MSRPRWRRFAALPLALGLLLSLAGPSAGYSPNGGKIDFEGDNELTTCAYSGFAYNYRGSINAGLREWSSAITLTITSLGTCEANGDIADIRLFSWNNTNCGFAIPHATLLSGQPTWQDDQVDIYFNTYSGCNWHTNYTTSVPAGKVDLFSVAAHEMGHVLGLGHNESVNSVVMSNGGPSHADCDSFIGRRLNVISQDDRNGVVNSYPQKAKDGVWPVKADCYQ